MRWIVALVLAGALAFTAYAILSPPAPAPTAEPMRPFTETLQTRLKRVPGDYRAWAQLATQYVDQARVSGDPAFYPKAEGALATAAKLAPRDDAVLTGRAALAAGRHEFSLAVRLARQAIEVNPYSAQAHGVLADALTQLGDLDGAAEAVDRMLGLRPGVPSLTRASYAAELRGDVAGARRLLLDALADAYLPADVAYARHYLGELALRSGDLAGASRWYAEAMRAVPSYTPSLAGQARVAALSGRTAEALDLYATVTRRLPLPQYLVEQGETRLRAGLPADWTLLRAQRRLYQDAGVLDDLTWAEFEADHGSPGRAVTYARAEFLRNPNAVAADALAWALHRAGDSRAALPYARKATASGWRNALLYHHRAEIERALGLRPSLTPGGVNPVFDPGLPALARFS
ncbi:tetratricopeptide repeat protein [Nonomuraea sp. NBC_01738]|uniref:tetratricopeptide repeat protein n=1 Tax=Nonomuraea sp. NBC_01738 TaxID=2976003 RepID=UPI002E0E4841|nr:tetratricopeptide repeat protein [Nonomuraea sp. NBC_01738]